MLYGIVGWCVRNASDALLVPYGEPVFRISQLDRDTIFSPLPRVHLAGILAVVPGTQ